MKNPTKRRFCVAHPFAVFALYFIIIFFEFNGFNITISFYCGPQSMIFCGMNKSHIWFLYFVGFLRVACEKTSFRLRRAGYSFHSNALISLRMISNSRRFFNSFRSRIAFVYITSIFSLTGGKTRFGPSFFGVYNSFPFINVSVYDWAYWFIAKNCLI